MKRAELYFSILLVPLDAAMILAAFFVAYQIRTQADVIYLLSQDAYLQFVLMLLPLWIIIFALEGLYRVDKVRRGADELAGIFLGVSSGVLLVTAAIFLTNTELGSRVVLLYAYILALLFVWFGRWVSRWLEELAYRAQIGTRNVMVIGTNDVAFQLIKEIEHNPGLGYRVIGHVSVDDRTNDDKELGKYLGTFADLRKLLKKHRPDEIIVAHRSMSDTDMLEILALTNQERIDLRLTPNVVGVQTSRVTYQTMAGIPLIEVQRTPLAGWGGVIKRLVDVVGSLAGIVIFSPLMLLTAFAVWITSPGPIIYKNERVGQDKKHFSTYKFRSMKIEHSTGDEYGGEEALALEQELIKKQNSRQGAVYKIANDPRLTPIGDFIRKTSLDELPQFFNVLFGTMSLVGPRPHQPREVAKYKPWQEKLFTIKPGVTGLAQISGRSDLNFDDEARLDISYIENWSIGFDLKILFRTPWALIQSRSRRAA